MKKFLLRGRYVERVPPQQENYFVRMPIGGLEGGRHRSEEATTNRESRWKYIMGRGAGVEKRRNGGRRDKTSKLNLLVLFVRTWARGVDSSKTIFVSATDNKLCSGT